MKKISILLTLIAAFGYGIFFLIFPVIFNAVPVFFLISFLIFLKNKDLFLRLFIFSIPLLTGGFYATPILSNSMFGIGILGVLNVLIPFFIFSSLFFRKWHIESVRLNMPIITFLVILGCAISYSPSFMRAMREWFRIAMPLSMYYLVLNIGLSLKDRKEFVFNIIKLLMVSSIIPVGVGFFQLISGSSRFVVDGLRRIYGTLGHPNIFSAFLIVHILLLFFMFVHENKLAKKIFYLACMFLMFFSLIFTFSRIGWVTFIICFTVIGVMKYREYYVFILSAFILICVCTPLISSSLLHRLRPDSSFYLRFSLNRFSWNFFAKSPLIGYGLASFPTLAKEYFGIASTMYGQEVGLPPHNDCLKFLTEVGIFGLLAYLFLIFLSLKLSLRIATQRDALVNSFGVCLVGIVLATFVLGLSDQGLKMMGIYPWILLGLGELLIHPLNHKECQREKVVKGTSG